MVRTKCVFAGAIVCCFAAVAVTKPVKIKSLTPAGSGVSENVEGDGMVMMKFHETPLPRTDIHVNIQGFLPNTTYGVQVDPGITDPQAITTNPAGNGSWKSDTVSFDVTLSNPIVRVFRWDGVAATIGDVSFDELRAIGCASGNCPVGQPCSVDGDCDDGGLCTIDTCNGGFCFHALELCDDNNACTADFCNPFDGSCENDLLPSCP